jgi:3-hydroxyisobutyrate dehydrogenase-like beta-hydroxyacid dehydrogenase
MMTQGATRHRLGWIGLGRMGNAIAERLATAGCDLKGYNRTRAKAEGLQKVGVTLVERPADLAACDIVFTMVSTADDLRSVLTGPDGLFAKDRAAPKILVELSTISPEASAEIRELAGRRGTDMLVVPVSGNDVVARAGKLGVIASGPRVSFDTVKPYLQIFGPSVTYVGEGEVSRILKICHNLYLGIVYEGLAEVTLLAQAHGVPRHLFLDVINKSVLGSTFTRYKTPVIANLDYTVTFTNTLMRKDLELGLRAASAHGVSLPATEVVRDLVQACIDEGRAEQDYTVMLDKLAEQAGMRLSPDNADVTDGLKE